MRLHEAIMADLPQLSREANDLEGLVQVDGKRLVHLMLDHEVGSARSLTKCPGSTVTTSTNRSAEPTLDSQIPFRHYGLDKLAGPRCPAPFERPSNASEAL